jgi:DegV family protein with EDD domain
VSRVSIVTDSTACFEDPNVIEDFGITIVPLNIHFGNRLYKDGIDLSPEDVFHHMRHGQRHPIITAPPVSAFEAVYKEINKTTDQICVLVSSQQFTNTFQNAQAARKSLLGRCDIVVLDSMINSACLGYLVEAVAMAAKLDANLEEVVRAARGIIPRLYSVYYVDDLSYIQQAGLIGETQAILGTMLEIKPLLTIEEGKLITMEKVRTHSHAIDRMIEFVTEFTHIERLSILQNTLRTTDRTRMLQDRLALELSHVNYPIVLYEPLITTLIGPDAMGMAVLEGTGDSPDDY